MTQVSQAVEEEGNHGFCDVGHKILIKPWEMSGRPFPLHRVPCCHQNSSLGHKGDGPLSGICRSHLTTPVNPFILQQSDCDFGEVGFSL